MTHTCQKALVLAGAVLAACTAAPLRPLLHQQPRADAQPRVALIRSADNSFFNEPMQAYLAAMPGEVVVFDAATSKPKDIAAAVASLQPDVIFCLGSAALQLAGDKLQGSPVLAAMIVNQSVLNHVDQDRLFGIAVDTDPLLQFAKFRLVAPSLSRVLTFADERSLPMLQAAQEALKEAEIDLQVAQVSNLDELREAYASRKDGVEGVWIPATSFMLKPEVFQFLRQEAQRDKKPLMTGMSDQLAKDGALMSVSLDLKAVGSQAALLTRRLVAQHLSPRDIGIVGPLGSRLAVNMTTAEQVGVVVLPASITAINAVFH